MLNAKLKPARKFQIGKHNLRHDWAAVTGRDYKQIRSMRLFFMLMRAQLSLEFLDFKFRLNMSAVCALKGKSHEI
jgi:hypothetical protein